MNKWLILQRQVGAAVWYVLWHIPHLSHFLRYTLIVCSSFASNSFDRSTEFCILVIIMDSHKHILFTCSFKCEACRRYWTQQLINFPIRFTYCPGCNQRTEAYYVVSKIVEKSNRFTVLFLKLYYRNLVLNDRCLFGSIHGPLEIYRLHLRQLKLWWWLEQKFTQRIDKCLKER